MLPKASLGHNKKSKSPRESMREFPPLFSVFPQPGWETESAVSLVRRVGQGGWKKLRGP